MESRPIASGPAPDIRELTWSARSAARPSERASASSQNGEPAAPRTSAAVCSGPMPGTSAASRRSASGTSSGGSVASSNASADRAAAERSLEARDGFTASPGGEDEQRATEVGSAADEVVEQREREIVHPLDVVDGDQREVVVVQRAHQALEHAHWFEQVGDRGSCLGPESGSLRLGRCETTAQIARRCEGHEPLRLVANDGIRPLRSEQVPGVREEPRLPLPRIGGEERDCRIPRRAYPICEPANRREFDFATDERPHGATILADPVRREPAVARLLPDRQQLAVEELGRVDRRARQRRAAAEITISAGNGRDRNSGINSVKP